MPIDEQKVIALREELRNGRIDQSSQDPDADDRDDDSAFRAAFQDAGGEVSGPVGNSKQVRSHHKQPASNRRSSKKKPLRVRQPNRRSGENNGRTPGDTAAADGKRTVGTLETEEPITVRDFHTREEAFTPILEPIEEKPGRGKRKGLFSLPGTESQADTKKVGPGTRSAGRSAGPSPLSEAEAAELAEPLLTALQDDFKYLDHYLWFRLRSVKHDDSSQPVWSDVDSEEMEALTRIIMKRAKRYGIVAEGVRALVDSADYITAGAISLPRLKRTAEILRETRQVRPSRLQRMPGHEN